MQQVRVWCPRYRPTCSCGCIPFATDPSTSRTSHLSRQPISANPQETDRIWYGTRRSSHMRFQSKFQRSCLPLHLAHGRFSNTTFNARQLGFHAKQIQQMGVPTKSQSWELRSMALHHSAKSLSDTQVDATGTQAMTSLASFHIFRNQDEQFVLCNFVIFIVIAIFRAIKPQITVISCNKRVLVLSTRLPSLVSKSDSMCSHARTTPSSMLGVSGRNVFLQSPDRSVHVQPQQHRVAETQSLHCQCLHPHSRFQ